MTPTPFQTRCIASLGEVLQRHGKKVSFEYHTGDVPGYIGELVHDGRRFSLEVYPATVVMLEGDRLYESYLSEEVRTDDSLIDGFSRRLNRFLSGGPWEGPEERGWFDTVLDAIFGRPKDYDPGGRP